MSDDANGTDEDAAPEEEPTTMSYRAVSTGLPVITHSGEQFGVVEHVLQVPEEDLFDGIVVYTGTGAWAANPRHPGLAGFEMLKVGHLRGWIRFVDADQVAAITPGYVKCAFEMDQVAMLPLPDGPPVLHPDMAEEDAAASAAAHPFASQGYNRGYGQYYGRWFRRPRWIR
jgi:hypothetical protein